MATVKRDTGRIVARIAGDSAAMDKGAAVVLGRAKAAAAAHRQTGHYINSFEVNRVKAYAGVTDREVVNTDPQAQKIEFGHMTRRSTKREGPARWVPGQFILTNAAKG